MNRPLLYLKLAVFSIGTVAAFVAHLPVPVEHMAEALLLALGMTHAGSVVAKAMQIAGPVATLARELEPTKPAPPPTAAKG